MRMFCRLLRRDSSCKEPVGVLRDVRLTHVSSFEEMKQQRDLHIKQVTAHNEKGGREKITLRMCNS